MHCKMVCVKGSPDSERRACSDCYYCRKLTSWWCMNSNASKHFGTVVPGRDNCEFWLPIENIKDIPILERLFGNIVKVDLDKINGVDSTCTV